MDQQEPRRRLPPLAGVAIAVVLVALLAAAGFVVVSNAHKATTGPVPGVLLPPQFDTTYRSWHVMMGDKVAVLSRRYLARRDSLKSPTPPQESLMQQCDSGLAALKAAFASFDTARTRRGRDAVVAGVRADYTGTRALVDRFVRSVGADDSLSLDSLDRVLKKLISD